MTISTAEAQRLTPAVSGIVIIVTTNLTSGLQTVCEFDRTPLASPCCGPDEGVTRTLDGDVAHKVAWGRPGIGNTAEPFACTSCGAAYVVVPNPHPSQRGTRNLTRIPTQES